MATKFAQIFPQWLEDVFEKLDASYIELKTEEWLNELKRLQKTNIIV